MEFTTPRMVYVVDDDAAVRDSLSILLESHGFAVSEHASGNEFLGTFGDGHPCCVVLDLNMPGLSGLEVFERLNARNRACPVIIVTGKGDPELRERLIQTGALAVFDKPFETDELVEAVASAFGPTAQSSLT